LFKLPGEISMRVTHGPISNVTKIGVAPHFTRTAKRNLLPYVYLILLALLCSCSNDDGSPTDVSKPPSGTPSWHHLNGKLTGKTLHDIWGTGPGNIYAVGDGVILHHDGTQWIVSSTDSVVAPDPFWGPPELMGIWGTADGSFYIAGREGDRHTNGIILHYDAPNDLWDTTLLPSKPLESVWGFSNGELIAVGYETVMHFDGNTWTDVAPGIPAWLLDVWGASPQDVYAVGYNSALLHYDGSFWIALQNNAASSYYAVRGTPADEVLIAGSGDVLLRYDGATWSTESTNTGNTIYSMVCDSSGTIFGAGQGFGFVQYDGTQWHEIQHGNPGSGSHFYGVWNPGSDHAIAVGSLGAILEYDAGILGSPNGVTTQDLEGVWAAATGEVYAVSLKEVIRYDGQTWEVVHTDNDLVLYDIWGSSATDVYAVGWGGDILHYDGLSWHLLSSVPQIDYESIWGRGRSDIFAAGKAGRIAHFDGATWQEINSGTTDDLRDIAGNISGEVFAVGGSAIVHHDGITWGVISLAPHPLQSVWSESSNSTFVASWVGRIFHYDGSEWKETTTLSGVIRDLWGHGGRVFAVGDGGVAFMYDGSQWSPMNSHTGFGLLAIWGVAADNVFAAGQAGTVLHYRR
jgi:hypothetical protein